MRQVVGERAQSHREILADEGDGRRHVQLHGSKIPDAADARRDELICSALRLCSGNSNHTDLNIPLGDDLCEIGNVLHAPFPDTRADDDGVAVKDRRKAEAEASNALIVRERRAQMPHADNGEAEVLVEAEDAADTLLELCDVVTDALFSELSEGGEILADLLGIDRETAAEFLGGSDADAFVTELPQAAVVARQAIDGCLGYRWMFLHSYPSFISPAIECTAAAIAASIQSSIEDGILKRR